MKKWLFAFTALIALLLVSCYVFIPNVVVINNEQGIHVTQQGLHRVLLDSESVSKWWPGEKTNGGFIYNGYKYKFIDNNISLIAASIENGESNFNTSIYLVSLATDSIHLAWIGKAGTSFNPIKRIALWRKVTELGENINELLKKMKQYYSNDANVYGIKVEKQLVKDSILITTSARSKEYPGTEFVYSLIDRLKSYAAANHVEEAGFPMLNIDKADTADYNVRVALPLAKPLPNSGDIKLKRMLGLGNILVTEVSGGVKVTTEAFKQIALYANDYKRTPPAIPFYSLVTDRRKQQDSTKWVTRIYFPVM